MACSLVRRVGFVPMPHSTQVPRETDGVGHLPGYVPDPLFRKPASRRPLCRTPSITLLVGADALQERMRCA